MWKIGAVSAPLNSVKRQSDCLCTLLAYREISRRGRVVIEGEELAGNLLDEYEGKSKSEGLTRCT